MNNSIFLAIRDIISGITPSIDVSHILYDHRCFYLLSLYNNSYSNLLTSKMAVNKLAISKRYRELSLFLEKVNLPYAIIKGAVLSEALYGSSFFRISGDVDFLVHRNQGDDLKYLLLSNGFIQGRVKDSKIIPYTREELLYYAVSTHQTAPYVKQINNSIIPFINIDVNFDIYWGEYEQKSDMDFVLSQLQKINILGTQVNKLSSEMEFISLCLHHYKDLNSIYLLFKNGMKLCYFSDIFFYVMNNKLDKKKLFDAANRLNAEKYLYYCLYYTNIIFDSTVIKDYLFLFSEYKDNSLIETYGLTSKEIKTWNIDFESRLFGNSLKEYFQSNLTQQDFNKININSKYI